jgi:nitrate/nitrite transporter NarK
LETRALRLDKEVKEDETVNLKDIKEFNMLFWLMLVMIVTSSQLVWSFSYIENKWIHLRFGIDEITTGTIISYSYAFQIIQYPIYGYIGDKCGFRTQMLMFHILSAIGSMLILILGENCDESSPCYVRATAVIMLMSLSFSLW